MENTFIDDIHAQLPWDSDRIYDITIGPNGMLVRVKLRNSDRSTSLEVPSQFFLLTIEEEPLPNPTMSDGRFYTLAVFRWMPGLL